MSSPPDPGLTAVLLEVARRVGWSVVAGEWGRLNEYALTVVRGDGPATVQWHVDGALPLGCGPRLISRAAYEALRAGELTSDGTLAHAGRRYRLADVWTGERFAADLVPASG